MTASNAGDPAMDPGDARPDATVPTIETPKPCGWPRLARTAVLTALAAESG
jgi:hypothetical protein